MPGKNIMVSATEAQPVAAVAAEHANIAQFELELGERESRRTQWPKITLVTAVHNGAKYLEATIRSVVEQGYPNLEYIVVDDGSTDGTGEIIRNYERAVSCWIRQENQGLYAALNAGFARANGEIMGWLNSSDLLQVNGLFTVGSVFAGLREVEWITGRPTKISATGMTIDVLPVPRWSRGRFLAGANHYIQQESTFWRRRLWEKAGGYADASRRMASDFELWVRFFRHAQLYPVEGLIGGFRVHDDSLGLQDLGACHRIHDELVEAELDRMKGT